MKEKFTIEDDRRKTIVRDEIHHYELCILKDTDDIAKFMRAFFLICLNGNQHAKSQLTGRDIDEYGIEDHLPMDKRSQYLEIGAGLGESVSHVVSTLKQKGSKRYTVIDPANFNLILDMLDYTEKRVDLHSQEIADKIVEFRRRASLMVDSHKVRLINMRLEDVIDDPEFQSYADILIDCFGSMYATTDGSFSKKLLKPKGISLPY